MKIAYLDCPSGISGDMTLGALVDAGVNLSTIQAGIDSLGLAGCHLTEEQVKRHGFRALKVTVEHEPEHAHRHLHHIVEIIEQSTLSRRQKDLANQIFTKLGEAEAKVHGTSIQKVHFHEVGAVDSIADIVGSAIGWDLLGADRIFCSPVPTGHGHIQIAHGKCTVPAPATAELLRGIPLADSAVQAELTTPTGAAIVATLVDTFGTLPPLKIDSIGYGAGDADFQEQANILRLLVGTTEESALNDRICLLETNLDDVSGEIIGNTTALLFKSGALDVYTTAIQMKKNRPGIMLSVLCELSDISPIENIIFQETGTLGIRHHDVRRNKLTRETWTVQTVWGAIEGKLARLSDGSSRFKPEYESCRARSTEHKVSLSRVIDAARQAFQSEQSRGES